MKKIIYSWLIIGALFISCSEDFLNEELKSNITSETYFLTEVGFEDLVNTNYSFLKNIYGSSPSMFCEGTDLYSGGKDTSEGSDLMAYTRLNPATGAVAGLYNNCYRLIQKVNEGLYYSEITEQTDMIGRRVGELKFLRAQAYFLLVQSYGGVALANEYLTAPQLSFSRNTEEEVYSFIITELNDAIAALPDESYSGRVTEKAAKNLLAKVYLTRAYESYGASNDFSMAAQLAVEVIGGQSLPASYGDLWTPTDSYMEINEETIFSVQYSVESVAPDVGRLGNNQASAFAPYMGGSENAGKNPARGEALAVTQYALDLFEEEDTRWDATFMTKQYVEYFDFYRKTDAEKEALKVAFYFAPAWADMNAFMDEEIAKYVDDIEDEYDELIDAAAGDAGAIAALIAERDAAIQQVNDDFAAGGSARDAYVIIFPYGTHSSRLGITNDNFSIPIRKFDDPDAPFGSQTSRRDIVIARLAETYLVAAEAYLGAGAMGTGLPYLNAVRERAGVDPVATYDIDFLLDERGRELLGEYHRWFDLKRTGTLVDRATQHNFLVDAVNFQGANGQLKILRPIPQSAIDLNQNNNFQQNPAYDN